MRLRSDSCKVNPVVGLTIAHLLACPRSGGCMDDFGQSWNQTFNRHLSTWKALTSSMIATMRFLLPLLLVVTMHSLHAQEPAAVTRLLKQLESPDIDARQQAMVELQTSLDPRIPEACLPVLTMEGDSIRRLAARAIGSRWHQIPAERIPTFVAALKPHLQSEHTGLVNMARRGIALLEHDFKSPMLSRSRSKRWVIYERRGLPCLIDTTTMTEELPGHPSEIKMASAYGNEEFGSTVQWHPKKDVVAMDMIQFRRVSLLWFWQHGKGLRQLSVAELCKAVGHPETEIAGAAGFFTEITGWKGDALEFTLSYSVIKGDDFIDHDAKLQWNSATDQLRVISDTILR